MQGGTEFVSLGMRCSKHTRYIRVLKAIRIITRRKQHTQASPSNQVANRGLLKIAVSMVIIILVHCFGTAGIAGKLQITSWIDHNNS
jgi:Na+/H+ antiporter NhaC